MAKLTKQDVGQIVKEMNDRYQPADGRCVATPIQMELLVDKLQAYTQEVQKAAESDSGVFVETKISSDTDVLQWSSDMAAWQVRLAHYKNVIDAIPAKDRNSAQGCEDIYPWVTAPLLDGIYYEVLPGVILSEADKKNIATGTGHTSPDTPHIHPAGHSTPRPPDVATPFSLGNQVIEYQDHQKERMELFWSDLWESALTLPNRFKKAVSAVSIGGAPVYVWVLGGAALIGFGYLLLTNKRTST